MELSEGKKKVDASRDTGIGRWVQEIGRHTRTCYPTKFPNIQ